MKGIKILYRGMGAIGGIYKDIPFTIYSHPKSPKVYSINGYRFEYRNLKDAYNQIVYRIDNNAGVYLQSYIRENPPFYAHNLYEKKTHGLTLKQMRRLYAMVSRGNQKAITYARNVLGIPFSESPSQVKAVVLHHVRDLAERKLGKMSFKKNEEYAEGWLKRRLRGNPFRSGGYLRETPKEAGYKVISLKGRQLILEDLADGKRELWARSPNFAGYAIFYKNNTYEFVTSVLPGMTPVLPRAGQPILGNPLSYHVGGLSSLGARGEERRRMRLGKMEYSALEFARKYPGWHGFNPKNPTGKVIKSLAKKGLVEISNISNQFKII